MQLFLHTMWNKTPSSLSPVETVPAASSMWQSVTRDQREPAVLTVRCGDVTRSLARFLHQKLYSLALMRSQVLKFGADLTP